MARGAAAAGITLWRLPLLPLAVAAAASRNAVADAALATSHGLALGVGSAAPARGTGPGCEGATLAGQADVKSVQALKKCVEALKEYAEEAERERLLSLAADKQYAGDLAAERDMLRKLESQEQVQRQVYRALRTHERRAAWGWLARIAGQDRTSSNRSLAADALQRVAEAAEARERNASSAAAAVRNSAGESTDGSAAAATSARGGAGADAGLRRPPFVAGSQRHLPAHGSPPRRAQQRGAAGGSAGLLHEDVPLDLMGDGLGRGRTAGPYSVI